jgi:hypothetical protein
MGLGGRVVRVVVLVALALLASGCVRFRGDLTVSADDLVSGTLVVALKIPDGAPAGAAADEPSSDDIPADLRDKVSVAPYAEDGYEGSTLTLKGLTFAELDRVFRDGADSAAASSPSSSPGSASATPGPAASISVSLRRDGHRLEMIGRFFVPTLSLLGGPNEATADADFEAKMRITFPGDVISTNGQKSGRTVTWNLRPSTVEFMQATTRAGGGAGGLVGWQLGAGVGLAVLLVGGVGLVWMRRRRQPAVAGGAAPWTGPPAGQQYGPTWPPGPGPEDWVWARPETGERPGLGTTPTWTTPPTPIPPGPTPPRPTPPRPTPAAPMPGPMPGGSIPGGSIPGGSIPGGSIPGGSIPGGSNPPAPTPSEPTRSGPTPPGPGPGGAVPPGGARAPEQHSGG